MFTISVSKEEVLSDFPFIIKKWIDVIKKEIKVDLDESKIDFYYSYGYFIPKVEDKEQYYNEMFEKCSKMLFGERLELELSKIRINLAIKSGNFFISDRLPKGSMPKSIKDIVTEITKVKMLVESEYHDNDKISDSIPDIDKNIVSFEIIRDVVNSDYSKSQKFDIDNILDKISKEGMDSLSDEEREFLDKKSKDL
jgi:hypothetical protein